MEYARFKYCHYFILCSSCRCWGSYLFCICKLNISKANVSAQKIIDDATSKADNLVKEAILDAKTQAYELKLEAEKEIKEQKQEITELENNLSEREKGIERRDNCCSR